MKLKYTFPILLLLASLFLAACFPFFEDDCYEEYSEEYCDSEYYDDEDFDDEEFDNEYDDEEYGNNDDEYDAEETAQDEYEADQNEEMAEIISSAGLSIESIPEYADPAFEVFSQYIDVFGVGVYATSDIPENKLFHAAGVMAQYLDNNEDGLPDDPDVIRALQAKQASIYIFPRPDSRAEEDFFDGIEPLLDSGKLALQPCYGEEIVPNGAARGEFDATLEEIFHLISNTGYAYAYPEAFGERRGTAIADAMDEARGGYFENIPGTYPAGAWFTYDDKTCEYDCMISEYHYWAITSLLGAQDFSGRFDEIGHEWRLNTPEKVKSGDPAIYALLTNPQYHQPSVLPDGNYQPE